MNPYNGDILAMASYPTFDPNLPLERGQDPKPRMNHAISVPFEPGSVFKVVTLSAALETTNLRPESPINCNGGKITFGSRTIHDSHSGMGVVPMATVLAKSSNVGAIQVGLRVGQQNMYDYMRRFGFGQKTERAAAVGIVGARVPSGALGQDLAGIGLDGAGSQRDHAATGAGGVRDRQWRHAGEAAAGAEEGQPDSGAVPLRCACSSPRTRSRCGR